MARNPFSGEMGADLETEIANYLRGDDDAVSGVGLGYDGADEQSAIGALSMLGFEPSEAIGAVKAAKAAARATGVPSGAAIQAMVKKYVDQVVRGRGTGTSVLAPDLSPGQAFKYEGSLCCAVITGSVGAGASASYETEIEVPCTIREIRFSTVSADLTLTDFKYGGSFPWLSLQFPISMAHFGPGAQMYKVRAVSFGTKTKFRATFANSGAAAIVPIMEFWGTATNG